MSAQTFRWTNILDQGSRPQLLSSFRIKHGRTSFSGRMVPVWGPHTPHRAFSEGCVGRVRASQRHSLLGPSWSGSSQVLVTS